MVDFVFGERYSVRADWDSIKQDIDSDFPNVPTINTEELAAWLNDNSRPQPILLDTRAMAEYNVSHLRGAVQVSNAKSAAKVTVQSRNTIAVNASDSAFSVVVSPSIVVYCSVGYRSAAVVDQLIRGGMENIYNLEGSIFQWFNEGRPVFRGDMQVDEVHPYDAVWGKLLHRRQA